MEAVSGWAAALYGASMPDNPIVIEGHVVHKKSNALKMSFQDGPGDPFAVGHQGAGDGKGAKLGVLFGFKNGGTGNQLANTC